MHRRVAVIGAGWAGLSAAVHATLAGAEVHVFEMASRAGGRARSVETTDGRFDNGQHILIGAYREALALMRTVGADPERCLLRCGLDLRHVDGTGLVMPAGAGVAQLLRAVLAASGWSPAQRLALAARAIGWRIAGFRCNPAWAVERLVAGLPQRIREDLVEPLCIAALNTPARTASAEVFLRVIHDGLFGPAGSADLLLPRVPLSELLAEPAGAWLAGRGAVVHLRHRVGRVERAGGAWAVDGEPFDGVLLATSAREASRLVEPIDREWSRQAGRIDHQPIATVWLVDPGLRWPRPMTTLRASDRHPAQFGFDLGALGGPAGHFAFVVSAASAWVDRGVPAVAQAVLEQARMVYPGSFRTGEALRRAHLERRATFACTPALRRPTMRIAAGLLAAGDYVEGPYPATLEGAVRSGRHAACEVARIGSLPVDRSRVQSHFAMQE